MNIYRTLLDEIIQGQIDKKLYFERFNLQSEIQFCDAVKNEYNDRGYPDIESVENALDLLQRLAFQMPTITTSNLSKTNRTNI